MLNEIVTGCRLRHVFNVPAPEQALTIARLLPLDVFARKSTLNPPALDWSSFTFQHPAEPVWSLVRFVQTVAPSCLTMMFAGFATPPAMLVMPIFWKMAPENEPFCPDRLAIVIATFQ